MIPLALFASLAFVVYTYAGYPLLLWSLGRRRRRPQTEVSWEPPVTVVIAAYNEEGCIGETLRSVLSSDYPPQALRVIVISDASTDRTDEIVFSFPSERVRLLRQETRMGQTASLLRGAQKTESDFVILADASGRFLPDTVRRLIRHFADRRVGAVSGYNGIRETGTAVSRGDGAYARYDRMLRALESRTGASWVGCQGGLFAIRKALFQGGFPLDMAADNATCYQLYERGYVHRFDPEAAVIERPPQDLKNEFRRKVRIIVLQLHGVAYFRRLFNPLKHPDFFFQNVSHKIFRWLVPFALIILWAASALSRSRTGRWIFVAQDVFYGLALVGIFYGKRRKTPAIVSIPAYFVTVNAAGFLAWGRLFSDYTIWMPPARESESYAGFAEASASRRRR